MLARNNKATSGCAYPVDNFFHPNGREG